MLLPINFFDGRFLDIIGTDDSSKKAALAFVDPLVRFVKSSNSLRQVLFQWFPLQSKTQAPNVVRVTSTLIEAFLEAVRENRNVDSVMISYPIPSSTLSPSLLPGMNLKTLNVDLDDFKPADEAAFAPSFQCMTTLQRLTLSGLRVNERFATSILPFLAGGCASLQELKLAGHRYIGGPYSATKELWTALAQVFYTATMLQHLELDGFDLNRADMEGLITCLKLPDNSSPSRTTISKLSFCNCFLVADSHETLIAFLQTTTSSEDDKVHGSSLRELYGLEPSKGLVTMLASSDGTLQGQEDGATTIGSQLQTVSFNKFSSDCADEFIRVSKWIRLRCLHLYKMDADSCRKLQRCLLNVPTIRELHVSLKFFSGFAEGTDMLYAMVRQSESLCVFSAKNELGGQLFNETRLCRIDAYCQRNQFLFQLTTGRRWDDEGDEHVERTPIVLNAQHFPSVARTAMRLSSGKLLGVISKHDQPSP